MSILRKILAEIMPSKFIIDNFAFRLSYQQTLILFSALVFIFAYNVNFLKPIDCQAPDTVAANDHCWYHEKLYSNPRSWNEVVGKRVIYPGISGNTPHDHEKYYHTSIHILSAVLIFQIMVHFALHYIWIVLTIQMTSTICEIQNGTLQAFANYIVKPCRKRIFRYLVYILILFLNEVVAFGALCLLDIFLGGQFLTYGYDWYRAGFPSYASYDAWNPMVRLFPGKVKCSIPLIGTSGDLASREVLCLMHINNWNAYLFLIIWFWYYLLNVVNIFAIVYELMALFNSKFRRIITKARVPHQYHTVVDTVLKQFNAADWFFIDLLAKNLEMNNFHDLMHAILAKSELTKTVRKEEDVERNELVIQDGASLQVAIKSV